MKEGETPKAPRFRPPALMFGIPIANVTMAETIDLIGELIAQGRARGRSHQIATVNVDFLVNAFDDPAIASILQSADVCLADGTPIVWWSAALGMPLRERVAGSDLVPRLFEASQSTGWRIHVFGSTTDVAARAKAFIVERYPSAHVSIDPGPIIRDVSAVDDGLLDAIASVDADILCLALGNPKQERFIRAHRDRLCVPVMIGIGGSLDMFVGERKRAPVWVQRVGLEWVARAVQEPRRLGRRYAHDIRTIVPRSIREWLAHRRRRHAPGLTIELAGEVVDITIGGETIPSELVWEHAASRVARGGRLRISTGDAASLSDRAAAELVGLIRIAHTYGSSVAWVDSMDRVTGALDDLGLVPGMLACAEGWQPERPA